MKRKILVTLVIFGVILSVFSPAINAVISDAELLEAIQQGDNNELSDLELLEIISK